MKKPLVSSSKNSQGFIRLSNVREQNLKSINVQIPKGKITVITGLSGSGKSTLAFNTLYAEGQRRYLQSLPSYARMFFHQMKKPKVESIEGICPSIAIDQKTVVKSFRSTLGTMTGVYDCLRLLFTKLAIPHCPLHHLPLRSQSKKEILKDILSQETGSPFYVIAPVVRSQKGTFAKEFRQWEKTGLTRARVDKKWSYLYQLDRLPKNKMHDIDLLMDQLILKDSSHSFLQRLTLSVEKALSLCPTHIQIEWLDKNKRQVKTTKTYSLDSVCDKCGFNFPPIDMKFLSFNHPTGACENCHGIGFFRTGTLEASLENREETPFAEGKAEECMEEEDSHKWAPCKHCNGSRLNELARSIYLKGKNLADPHPTFPKGASFLFDFPEMELQRKAHC